MSSIEHSTETPEAFTQWAKKRATDLLQKGELREAINSMVLDLSKDPTRNEEQKNMIILMGMELLKDPQLDAKMVRDFLEGFSGVAEATKRETPRYQTPEYEKPKYIKPEMSEEDIRNAEDFINAFVLENDDLTAEAKEFITNSARKEQGPWSVKNFVRKVTQTGNKITIRNNQNGEWFLYVK